MIRIMLGNPGSGKTASIVREIVRDDGLHGRKTYTNIDIRGCPNVVKITTDMIIKKTVIRTKKNGEEEYRLELNREFWSAIKEPINVVIDEAHSILNPRRSMSKVNIIVSDWLAMIRRVIGGADLGYGEVVLITQLERRIDVITREMATQYRFHRCHYRMSCDVCGFVAHETNDSATVIRSCPSCRRNLKKDSHRIEVFYFQGMDAYYMWLDRGLRTYYRHVMIDDIEEYFPNYDTVQWDDMFSKFYS